MGAGFSQGIFPCFNPENGSEPDAICARNAPPPPPLDEETLGHSFCYVRSSARFLTPTTSDRFLSPSQSLRFDDSAQQKLSARPSGSEAGGFRAISGASVSANSSTPLTCLQLDDIYDDAPNTVFKGFAAGVPKSGCSNGVTLDGFESTASFSALPLQRPPRGSELPSGPHDRTIFMSGPIERGALSGPLEGADLADNNGGVPFSAPLGGKYPKRRKKKKKSVSGIGKSLYRSFSVVPVMNLITRGGGRKDVPTGDDDSFKESAANVQWALGKAGEDRVHVVVSEELGWLFVGIYDGFNGPDAPEFLMSHFYKAMYGELEGLFWIMEDDSDPGGITVVKEGESESRTVKKVVFAGQQLEIRRRRLWEFLVEDHPDDGLDLSGSQRFAFSVDDALSLNVAGSAVTRRSLLLSKLKHGLLNRRKDTTGRSFPWRFWPETKSKEAADENPQTNKLLDPKRKVGIVDHESVLTAMARALDATEQAYLNLTDRVLDRYPELALMGSCLLVVLMRDDDVYVMNVGDSRAIVAQFEHEAAGGMDESETAGGIVEESAGPSEDGEARPGRDPKLSALQLSTDHSTSIEEEIVRIQNEHPDDDNCIVNGRVKGRLKVTRAFGAGFLKQV
ncbi:hypothetical protein M569_17542 [Genlisea aurea]|uniref:PPM-type phosphatase domain-containing protein n=1 Tax=Genlisea aurea TaxID=192259 RepID=S8D3J2_9LAMI|nr:hypothetical protein M569_17542 [Genlisea aurea]